MSTDATNIENYVSLIVDDELSSDDIKLWFDLAKNGLPSGLSTTVVALHPKKGRVSVPLVCRHQGSSHHYIIPLTRHALEEEVEPIVRRFAKKFKGDFDVMVSKNHIEDKTEDEKIEIEAVKYRAVCEAFAKKQHEIWLADRLARGWRFGTTMSLVDKTSPMIRKWEDLPDELRRVDYEHPQTLVDVLTDQGYAVIAKSELTALYGLLMRNI